MDIRPAVNNPAGLFIFSNHVMIYFMRKNNTLFIIGIIAVVAVGIILMAYRPAPPAGMVAFAECLGEKGATFYGAFWCPHCQNQKAMFGAADKYLPYVECSTPDAKGQLPVCTEKEIKSYPTWEFADGSRLTGEIALETLATKTGCELGAPTGE